jgi:hypothetical protein
VLIFLSSDSLSSSDNLRSLSSRETENGIRVSPGLLVSIQALIFGSLSEIMSTCVKGLEQGGPFILFPDVILFAEVHQVCDGLCGEELKGIDDIDLRARQIPDLNWKIRLGSGGTSPPEEDEHSRRPYCTGLGSFDTSGIMHTSLFVHSAFRTSLLSSDKTLSTFSAVAYGTVNTCVRKDGAV